MGVLPEMLRFDVPCSGHVSNIVDASVTLAIHINVLNRDRLNNFMDKFEGLPKSLEFVVWQGINLMLRLSGDDAARPNDQVKFRVAFLREQSDELLILEDVDVVPCVCLHASKIFLLFIDFSMVDNAALLCIFCLISMTSHASSSTCLVIARALSRHCL